MSFNYAPTRDFLTQVRLGKVAGYSIVAKRGMNPDIDKDNFEEVRWEGVNRVPLQTAVKLEVFSDDNADTDLSGPGTWKVELHGYDANYNRISEIVSLNGIAGSLPTVQDFIDVHRVDSVENGTFNSTNVGTITVETSGSAIQITMAPDTGVTSDSHYIIPAGKTGYIVKGTLESNVKVDKEVEYRFMGRLNSLVAGPPFPPVREVAVWSGTSGIEQIIVDADSLPELTEVWFEGTTELNNTLAGVSYEVLLIDNQ